MIVGDRTSMFVASFQEKFHIVVLKKMVSFY